MQTDNEALPLYCLYFFYVSAMAGDKIERDGLLWRFGSKQIIFRIFAANVVIAGIRAARAGRLMSASRSIFG